MRSNIKIVLKGVKYTVNYVLITKNIVFVYKLFMFEHNQTLLFKKVILRLNEPFWFFFLFLQSFVFILIYQRLKLIK